MLMVLLLAGAEKLINLAISSDEVTKAGLAPLIGKSMRLDMAMPNLHIDVLFNDGHIRFEPVTTDRVFEPRGDERQLAHRNEARIGRSQPDCTVTVDNPAQLLTLMRSTEGNLPISGDYKVLMHIKQLIAGFDPDIAENLEPIIGQSLAAQLHVLITQLHGNVRQTATRAFNEACDWADDVTGNGAPDPKDLRETNDLKQQLLRLRADVEREEARLAAIKAELAQYQKQDHPPV